MKCSLKDAENIYICTIKNKEDIRNFILSNGVRPFYSQFLIDLDPTQFLHFCMAVIDYKDNCDVYASLLDFLSPESIDHKSSEFKDYHRLFDLNMDKVEDRVVYLRAANNSSIERDFLSLNKFETLCESRSRVRL